MCGSLNPLLLLALPLQQQCKAPAQPEQLRKFLKIVRVKRYFRYPRDSRFLPAEVLIAPLMHNFHCNLLK